MPIQQPSAVRFYAPDHPDLALTVRARLEKRRQQQIENLILAKDWDDHNRRVGMIRGIEEAMQIAAEAEHDLTQRKP
jgi:hypothetical protein